MKKQKTYNGPTQGEKIVERLITLMKSGKAVYRKRWNPTSTLGRHRNFITGKEYQGANPALLEMELCLRETELPLWCGRAQAKAKGFIPKKGTQGAYVLRPNLVKKPVLDENGTQQKDKEGNPEFTAFMRYKEVCVFNADDLRGVDEESQLELNGLITAATCNITITPEHERIAKAEEIAEAWQEKVKTKWGGDRAFYRPSTDHIQMPLREQFISADALYGTWYHEMVHSSGHGSRLGRKIANRKGDKNYAREELVAELGSFLICNRLSISSDEKSTAAYLEGYIEVLKQGPKVLYKVLADASAASNLICGPEVIEEDKD